jgi:hypothetical protein
VNFTPTSIVTEVELRDGSVTVAESALCTCILGDVNCDGEITAADVTLLRLYRAGHPIEFPIGSPVNCVDCPIDCLAASAAQTQSSMQTMAVPMSTPQPIMISASHESAAIGEYVDIAVSLDTKEQFKNKLTN